MKTMENNIHSMEEFNELFTKISYAEEKLWIPYTVMMLDINEKDRKQEFWEFLKQNLHESDTIFDYSSTRYIIVLEDTPIKGAVLADQKFRERMKEQWIRYKYHGAAVQWYSIEDFDSLEDALVKRLIKAKECLENDFVISLDATDVIFK